MFWYYNWPGITLALWLACGVITAVIADKKGKDFLSWLFIGLIGGLISLAIILGIEKTKGKH